MDNANTFVRGVHHKSPTSAKLHAIIPIDDVSGRLLAHFFTSNTVKTQLGMTVLLEDPALLLELRTERESVVECG